MTRDVPDAANRGDEDSNDDREHDELLDQDVDEDHEEECRDENEHPVRRALDELVGALNPVVNDGVVSQVLQRETRHVVDSGGSGCETS